MSSLLKRYHKWNTEDAASDLIKMNERKLCDLEVYVASRNLVRCVKESEINHFVTCGLPALSLFDGEMLYYCKF